MMGLMEGPAAKLIADVRALVDAHNDACPDQWIGYIAAMTMKGNNYDGEMEATMFSNLDHGQAQQFMNQVVERLNSGIDKPSQGSA